MAYEALFKIDKPYFTTEDVARTLSISASSAAVLCSRYAKQDLLVRLKKGLYARKETLPALGWEDLFRIANLLQVPSYVSLTTALAYHGITTQVQRGFIESISIKRTVVFDKGGLHFRYTRIKPELYGGFTRERGAFIALPEKALLDASYLASLGRYGLDTSALGLEKLDRKGLFEMARQFPGAVARFIERQYEKIRGT
jgi:Transcriptional regulator, AbiEi antitoxin